MANIGEKNITQIRSFSGKNQYPSLMEKEIKSIDISKIESKNIIISFLFALDKVDI